MPGLTGQKARVREFWNREPCGTGNNPFPAHTREYFRWIEEQRDTREPFIARFARWPEWRGRRVLEMGVGAGTDFLRFAREGADAFGIDLTDAGVRLVRERLAQEQARGSVLVGDVEQVPFPDDCFDFVYSWGVIHHTENTPAAAREVVRVLKPGGEFCVMIYHRFSLVCLQAYLIYGLLRGRPFASIDDIARDHLESFGTKVYTTKQARQLFDGCEVRVVHVMTPYDLRYSRYRFLPDAIGRMLPSYFGYFLVIEGRKA